MLKGRYAWIFLGFLFTTGVWQQGVAQSDLVTGLARQLQRYSRHNFQEKIYVHTDKSFYVCGEIIWFRIYNVDAFLNKPEAVSKVAYAELLSTDQQPALQAKIELREGAGMGSLLLPFSLNSGTYVLRVYTNWMKNFDPDLFFEKPVTIVNTLKKLPAPQVDSAKYSLRFFPEGGNLVTGIESKVAFQVMDHTGKAVSGKGTVFNQNNDSIAVFETFRFGRGSFSFKPVAGNKYTAAFQTSTGTMITGELPPALETGVVMKLEPDAGKNISVLVRSNTASTGPVFLVAHTRQVVKLAEMKPLVNGFAAFQLSPDQLGEGISHFTLFNEERKPLCERLYFRKPQQKLDIGITPDANEYGTRQQVSIDLAARIAGQLDRDADLSVSVFRVDSLQTSDANDIQHYLWLCSELRGNIESPSYFFGEGDEVTRAAEDLVLTHGWSRFKWEQVLSDSPPALRFLPEYEGPVVSALVREKITGQPAANTRGYLTIPGERFAFRTTTADKAGKLLFNLDGFYGSTSLVLQAGGNNGTGLTMEVQSPFSDNFSSRRYTRLFVPEPWQEQLLSRSVSTQVENTYAREKRQQFYLPLSDTTAFFGKPDKTYYLDNYTRFITLEEVMREYVAEVRVRKQQDHFVFRVKNEPYNVFFEEDPLVLIDGLPVFDIDQLMAFDPMKIRKLELVTRKFYSGNSGVGGIVSYSTYRGNLDGFPIDPNAVVLEYDGLQAAREFYSPVYATPQQEQSPVPDFRNLLYWSPQVLVSNEGTAQLQFYTSDRPGRYAVVVQGIDPDGNCGSNTGFFTVTR